MEAMSVKEYHNRSDKSIQWLYKCLKAGVRPDGVASFKDSAGVKILFVDPQWLRKNPVKKDKKV